MICFITPNTFLRQPRYGDLRKVLLHLTILKILDLGENIFEDAVVPVAITLLLKNCIESNEVKFVDLRKNIREENNILLSNDIDFMIIRQDNWLQTYNNSFIENIRISQQNEDVLDNILEMKDCGFKYQRNNVGLSQKGKNDLADRIFYQLAETGIMENVSDIPILVGKDIDAFYYEAKPHKILRYNYKELLRDNETTYFNSKIMYEQKKLIWRQTAPYFIGTILSQNIFFGNTIQAGIIKPYFKDRISYEYLCGLLNSSFLRNLYEQNVKEGGRVFPQVKLEKLKPLPVIIPTDSEREQVEHMVHQIIIAKKNHHEEQANSFERLLNQIVNKLYS